VLDWLLVKELSPRSFHSLVVLGHLKVGTFGVLRRFREDIILSFSSNTCSTHLRHEWLLCMDISQVGDLLILDHVLVGSRSKILILGRLLIG
jgi:hypothetical protein